MHLKSGFHTVHTAGGQWEQMLSSAPLLLMRNRTTSTDGEAPSVRMSESSLDQLIQTLEDRLQQHQSSA